MKIALIFLFLIAVTAHFGTSDLQKGGSKEPERMADFDNTQPLVLSGPAKLHNNKNYETLIWIPRIFNPSQKYFRILIYLDPKREISDENVSSENKKIATDAILMFIEYLKILVTGKFTLETAVLSRENSNVTSKRFSPCDHMKAKFLASLENKIKSFRYVSKSKYSAFSNYPSAEEDSDAILEVDVSLSDSEMDVDNANVEDEGMPRVYISLKELKDNYAPFDPIIIDITSLIKQTKIMNRVGRQHFRTRQRLQELLGEWVANNELNTTREQRIRNQYLQDRFMSRDLPVIMEWLNSNMKNATRHKSEDRREYASDQEISRSKRAASNTTEYLEDITEKSPRNMVTILIPMPNVIFTKSEISLEHNSMTNSSDAIKTNSELEDDSQKDTPNNGTKKPFTFRLPTLLSRRYKGKLGEKSSRKFIESRSPFRTMRDPSELFQAVARRYGYKQKEV